MGNGNVHFVEETQAIYLRFSTERNQVKISNRGQCVKCGAIYDTIVKNRHGHYTMKKCPVCKSSMVRAAKKSQ